MSPNKAMINIEQLQRRNQELEMLNTISQAVGETLQIDEVLDTVLIHLAKIVPYDSASIALRQGGRLRIQGNRIKRERKKMAG